MIRRIQFTFIRFHLRLIPQQSLFFGFLAYIVGGWLLLSMPFSQQHSISLLDNLFTATSALSTTGLTTVSISGSYTFFGQLIVLLLIQMGGIGYMTLTSYLLIATSRQLTHWHLKLMKTEFTMPEELDMRDFLKSVVVFTLGMEALGTLLFYIGFAMHGMYGWETVWSSVFHSISSFCTAGFSLFDSSFMNFSSDIFLNMVIILLSLTGALGFIMVTDCYNYLRKRTRRLTFTSAILLTVMLLLIGGGTLVYFFSEPHIAELSAGHKLLVSVFQSMSALTTVGFNSTDISVLSQPVVLITVFLMYVGASPSSTAGGLKITTITAIFAMVKSRLQGKPEITLVNRKIPKARAELAVITFIVYTAILFLATFLLTFTEHVNFEKILFEVTSAIGTVGLSMGITADLSAFGKWVIITVMFIGRIGVITFSMALLSRKKYKQCMVEEDLAV